MPQCAQMMDLLDGISLMPNIGQDPSYPARSLGMAYQYHYAEWPAILFHNKIPLWGQVQRLQVKQLNGKIVSDLKKSLIYILTPTVLDKDSRGISGWDIIIPARAVMED